MQLSFFPSRTISLYMGRMFLTRSLAVLAMLVVVLQTLDLLGQSGDILAQPQNGEAELWTYVSLRAPQIIDRMLPFSVLLGTLITLVTLNQNSEVIAMKASGLSAHQVLAPLVMASLLVAAFAFIFKDMVVAPATGRLTQWERADYGPIPPDSGVQTNVWVRVDSDVIHAGRVSGHGADTRLSKVKLYRRERGSLRQIVTADEAVRAGDGWTMRNARLFDVTRGTETRLDSLAMGKGVTPDQFTLASVDPESHSFLELRSAIADLEEAGRPTASLRANMWHKISGPLSAMLMPLLGSVAAFGLARSGQLFVRTVLGMALGFTYFVADNFALAMGNLGAYPPLVSAWAPLFLFLLVGETVLIRTEE